MIDRRFQGTRQLAVRGLVAAALLFASGAIALADQTTGPQTGVAQLATGAVFGAVFGALITGVLRIVGDWMNQASSRRALAAGFRAEIDVGMEAMKRFSPLDSEIRDAAASAENSKLLQFLAANGIPYQFYNANNGRVGELEDKVASAVVKYYSTVWQFFKAKTVSPEFEKDIFTILWDSGLSALEVLSKTRPT
jgi:hypothetical protein